MLFEPKQNHFGLDISDRSLKAVEVKRSLRGKPILAALSTVAVPEGVFDDGALKNPSELSACIARLLGKPMFGKFSTGYTVACLPETKTFIKLIDIPPMPPEERAQGVRWEAEHHIPVPIDETYWDWQLVNKETPPNARLPILLGVVPKDIVDTYTGGLATSHLTPLALEIEAVAITRTLFPNQTGTNDPCTIVIDLGATRTSLIVVDNGVIQFTASLPLSGKQITNTIATEMKFTLEQAEEAKCLYGLDPAQHHGALAQVLQTAMDELVSRLTEAIVFYREHFPDGHNIEQVLLCGGGAYLKNLDQYLANALSLSVTLGNPQTNLEVTDKVQQAQLLSYTTAIGLALRNTGANIL